MSILPHQKQLDVPLAVVTIHDACPAFSPKIFKFTDEVEGLDIKYNIALVPFFNEKQDLPSFHEFVDKIKSCKRCEIALHGLYHEDRNGQFDDFHTVTKAAAEEEIRAGLEIFQEIGIKPNVFVPPAWKLNDSSIKVLEKLGFILAEMQEEFILLSDKAFRKIKVPKVLNWDSTGYPEKNIINVGKDERHFKLLMEEEPQIIRIALHPRDPHQALKEQKEMICELKDKGYRMLTYMELIPKLQGV
ncbi:MAG: deacetylase-like protein [Nitrososphaeraceae archaeon]|jgi:predicted deacetylase|nr:deacetylase-like protein [Nitrososphaeraceae archaeon]